jgi:hypothetical protein
MFAEQKGLSLESRLSNFREQNQALAVQQEDFEAVVQEKVRT